MSKQVQKQTSIKNLNVKLKRMHSKLGEIITWEVLDEEGRRVGIIARKNSEWLEKRVSWQRFKVKYWIGHRFAFSDVLVDSTRDGLIRKMLGRECEAPGQEEKK